MDIIAWLLAFVTAITIHEYAHAWMSNHLGDPTAKLMGRLTLNPKAHYDPVGTTLLLGLSVLRALGVPVIPFGWAKPVMFDPFNLKNPRRDSAIISLSGPLANIVLAVVLSLILRLAYLLGTPFGMLNLMYGLFIPIVSLNLILALFNLVPFHPLDGGKIFVGFLPEKDAHEAEMFLRRYGMIILFLLIFPTVNGTSPIFAVLSPILNFLLNILLPIPNIV